MAESPVEKIRGRLLRRVLLGPSVMLPTLAGAIGVAGAAAMHEPLWGVGSLALMLGAMGLGLTRWINLPESEVKAAVDSVRADAGKDKRKQLDNLIRRLEQDKDPRPESYLGNLLALEDAIKELGDIKGLPPKLMETVRSDITELIERSVRICEDTIDLHLASTRMPTAAAKKILNDQREAKVAQLLACVAELEAVLHEIITRGAMESDAGAKGIRDRLRSNLEAARSIDERTRDDEADKLDALRQRYGAGKDTAEAGADGDRVPPQGRARGRDGAAGEKGPPDGPASPRK
jgi:CHASE3 domain sensor protein